MPGVLRLALAQQKVSHLQNGRRTPALPFSLKSHRFLLMLWLNTVAVKAFILSKFSSGGTNLCSPVSVKKEP